MAPNRNRSLLAASRGLTVDFVEQQKYQREVRPVQPATIRNYAYTTKIWKEFLSWYGHSDIDATLEDSAPLPKPDLVKRFLLWYAMGSKGTLGELITLTTCENTWNRLSTVISRGTGRVVDEVFKGDMLGVRTNPSVMVIC